jgi:GTP cyclohydrolase II
VQAVQKREPPIVVDAEAVVPTRHGVLRMAVFRERDDPAREHVALIAGDVRADDVLVRVHSECMTSEVFGSLKCDCAEQLEIALGSIVRESPGVVLYMRQEGRSIGLANKIRAYALQARGLDTVDANRALGLPDDARRYDGAAAMLAHLGVRSVRLLTNNPDKVDALRRLGVDVRGREPIVVDPNPTSLAYLEAKRQRMRHHLPDHLAGIAPAVDAGEASGGLLRLRPRRAAPAAR